MVKYNNNKLWIVEKESQYTYNSQNFEWLRTYLTFWRQNYFFNISNTAYKMWIRQEPNMLDLWNKLHFEEEKMETIYRV